MRGRLPKTGSYTGDGVNAVSIHLGFEPFLVLLYNETDGDVMFFQMKGAAAAKGLKIKDTGVGVTDLTFVATNGITIGSTGFKVGADADLIESAKVYRYIAF